MLTGLAAGIFWALDTVILGIALAMTGFTSTEQAVMLAPFVSTFLHDTCSAVWMFLYMGIRKQYKQILRALTTRSGRFIILGAVLGGPIGMSGYVAAIHYIGPAYTAIISSMYPALGALLSYVFLKEKMSKRQLAGLLVSILGVIVLSYAPGSGTGQHFGLGILCACICCIGWASEAVICAYGMKDPNITDEHALQIRQVVSSLVYGGIILNVLRGWKVMGNLEISGEICTIALAALAGTVSYLCYYKAIQRIGPTKAMALNITYAAWSVVFSVLFLGTLPNGISIAAGVSILLGSFVAARSNRTTMQI